MATIPIESIVKKFEKTFNVALKKVSRKKVIYDGEFENGKQIAIVSPSSKIYPKGNGWIDLTKIQIELLMGYENSYAGFRLANGTVHYLNLKSLFPVLDSSNMLENQREGEHWKLDIWEAEIIIRNGDQVLGTTQNINNLA